MGLRIIYGRAGSGKSEYIYREINEKIKNKENKKIYIITPEQFSFTAEQKLMEGIKSIINAEVVTFNRLAYRIINETGGVINTNLSKCGKAMLIYSILQNKKSDLVFLNKSNENVDVSMRTITELKKHGVRVQDLKDEQEKIENKYLKSKLNDIILIYENFEENIKEKYIDETDLLSILAENIDKISLLRDSIIYIDEFAGFTEQEYLIIKKLIELSGEITITSCIDNLDFNTDPNIDIFYQNKITLKKLLNLLEDKKKIEFVNLDKLYRFKNEELFATENNLYNRKIQKHENDINNINLFLAKNEYTEIEKVAKEIIKLVKQQSYRYRDISIITKNIDKYSNLARAIFSKYEIPIFIDEKRDLNQNIVIQYVLSILEIFTKNYSYEAIFNYLKTGFIEVEQNDVFKLEKYCLKYGIKNNKLKKDFTYGINDNNKEEINNLNEIRKQIINPLVELKSKIDEQKNIKNIVEQVYLFLINQNIEQKLTNKIEQLKENNLLDLAKEYEESYKILLNVFDEMVLIFENEKITVDKFNEILKIGLRNSGLGKIPGMQDQVIMGDVDRSRSRKVKAVFIIGLNDGVFPSINTNEGFLDDQDRSVLKQDGIELAKGSLENLYDDNFNIYKAFTTAEEKLFLSYSSSDVDGKSLRASSLILKIKKIFPKLQEQSDMISRDNVIEIINEKNLYENLILEINKMKNGESPEKLFYTIYEYYNKNKEYSSQLNENIKYINYDFNEKIKQENVQKLYGNSLNTSISKLEKYNSCPYSYFLQYVLRLKEKEELKIQNIDTGTFMHDVINCFFEEVNNNVNNITEEQLEKIVEKIIEEKLLKNNNYIFTATAKYKLLINRLKRIVIKALKYIIQTIVQSEFDIHGTEVEFADKGKYKPIVLNLENGKSVEITGKIDRIDIAKDSNNNYVRIIDYKSSIKDMDFNDIYAGLQLQLITYLDTVCKQEDFVPAGMLYFSLLEQVINSSKKLSAEEIEEKIRANFKMKGLILADVKVAQLHDKNLDKGASKIVPAYIDSTGTLSPKRSSIASNEEFAKLQNYINKTIKEIASEIFKGNIELKPYYKNKKTPCEYCSYKSMCNFNSGVCKNSYRFIKKMSKDEVLEKI